MTAAPDITIAPDLIEQQEIPPLPIQPELQPEPREGIRGGINELERYDRQLRIWGKQGQQQLAAGKVTIIGAGNAARYTALPLAALGVGELRLLGSTRVRGQETFLDVPLQPNNVRRNKDKPQNTDTWNTDNDAAVYQIAKVLRQVNPNCTVLPLALDLETRLAQEVLEGSTVIVDATNDPRSKALGLEFARKNNIPLLTLGVGSAYAKMQAYRSPAEIEVSFLMPQFSSSSPDLLLSLLWGGLAAEEIKKILLRQDNGLSRSLYYKKGAEERFTFCAPEEKERYLSRGSKNEYETKNGHGNNEHRNKSILVVGAGALGNFMSLALAQLGFGQVDYLDYDLVESHNLNRQVLFYDAVGLEKSTTLARKHKVMDPQAQTRGMVDKFELGNGKYSIERAEHAAPRYDLVLDLVDNFYARALLSAYAVQREIPLISAASSPEAAQVAVYVPGVTSCLDHVFNGYYQQGLKEEIGRRRSCLQQPDPSVIVTNQVAAALAALEIPRLFNKEERKPFPGLFNGFLKYSTTLDSRLGQTPLKQVCDCHAHKERIPNLELGDTYEQ